MTTITAKQLRQDLKAIIERVQAGEEVRVTYRSGKAVRIVADAADSQPSDKLAGLAAFDAAPKKDFTFDPDKSFKELYHEALEKKHGKYAR